MVMVMMMMMVMVMMILEVVGGCVVVLLEIRP